MSICQQIPEWVTYLLVAYPVLVHLRTLAPVQAQGAIGLALAVLDGVLGNYRNCKNAAPVDQQNQVTPRP